MGAPPIRSRITDMEPLYIEELIGNSRSSVLNQAKLEILRDPIKQVERYLCHHRKNVLLFCKQGARRSAAFCGFFLMCKTRCSARQAFDHLKGVRAILEDCVYLTLQAFENSKHIWQDWLNERYSVPLPICAEVGQWQDLLKGYYKMTLQVQPIKCWKLARNDTQVASSSSQPPAVARTVMVSDQVDAAPAEKKKKQRARPP